MSSDINRVNLTGRITRDAEQRVTSSGMEVYHTGIAVNDRRKGASGEWEDVPNFLDLVIFGARGKALAERGYLNRGVKCAIEGKLRYRSWEAQDGSKRSKVEVIVDDFVTMQSRETKPKAEVETSAEAPAQEGAPTIFDEDIPF